MPISLKKKESFATKELDFSKANFASHFLIFPALDLGVIVPSNAVRDDYCPLMPSQWKKVGGIVDEEQVVFGEERGK